MPLTTTSIDPVAPTPMRASRRSPARAGEETVLDRDVHDRRIARLDEHAVIPGRCRVAPTGGRVLIVSLFSVPEVFTRAKLSSNPPLILLLVIDALPVSSLKRTLPSSTAALLPLRAVDQDVAQGEVDDRPSH